MCCILPGLLVVYHHNAAAAPQSAFAARLITQPARGKSSKGERHPAWRPTHDKNTMHRMPLPGGSYQVQDDQIQNTKTQVAIVTKALTCHYVQMVFVEGGSSASHPYCRAAAKHRPKERVRLIEARCMRKDMHHCSGHSLKGGFVRSHPLLWGRIARSTPDQYTGALASPHEWASNGAAEFAAILDSKRARGLCQCVSENPMPTLCNAVQQVGWV